MNDDHARARQFIIEFFSDEELSNFCFDYFPLVYNEFTSAMRKSQKVLLLVDTIRRRGLLPDLLAALERERPAQYKEHFEPAVAAAPPRDQPVGRNPRQLFISHAAHEDDAFARRLVEDLKGRGWAIWIAPDSIRPGEKWVEAINRGMAESGVFVLILTEASVNSRWVRNETNVAIAMEAKDELRFLPLELEEVEAPPLWRGYQWISFRDDYKAGLESLLETLLETLQPEEMGRLSRLYDQLRASVGSGDWGEAQRLGQEILDAYPDYRETAELLAVAEREEKRQEVLNNEAAQLYDQLPAAIAAGAWDEAWRLIGQIQERNENYRDVPRLAKIVGRRRRRRDGQALQSQLAWLKRLPAWSWAILILVPVTLVILPLAFNGCNSDLPGPTEVPLLTDTATATSVVPPAATPSPTSTPMPAPTATPSPTSTPMPAPTATPSATSNPTPTPTATPSPTSTPTPTPTATPSPTSTPTPTEEPEPPRNPQLGDTWTRPADGMVMVYVPPEAPFVLESGVVAPTEGYWIDKYEVSNAQYQICLDAGKCQPSPYANDERFNGANHPVAGVTWFDATDYSAFVGGALPTVAEWKYAAVGNNGTDYPWGDDFDGTRLNFCDANCTYDHKDETWNDGYAYTAPVGSYPAGESWVGAANMAGNVREWTASPWGQDSDKRLIRGGCWSCAQGYASVSSGGVASSPDDRYATYGFRLVYRVTSQ